LVFKFRNNLKTFFEKLRNDDELRRWAKESKQLFLDLIEKPDLNRDDDINRLIRKGRKLSEKYRDDLNRLWKQTQRIMDEFKNDPVVQDFENKLQALGEKMILNSEGQPDLNVMEESMVQIKNFFVPIFRDLFIDVPIKRIEVRDKEFDCTIEDISIKGTGLVPDHIQVRMSSFSDLYPQKSTEMKQHFELYFKVENICPEFRGIKLDYEKKTFPALQNSVVADFNFNDSGISFDVTISIVIETGKITKAKLHSSNISVGSITINVQEAAKHEWIEKNMIAPIIARSLGSKLENSLEKYINDRLKQFISRMNHWFKTNPFERAKDQGNETLQSSTEKLTQMKKDVENQMDSAKKDINNRDQQKDLTFQTKRPSTTGT